MKTIIVTGASGFLGSHFVRKVLTSEDTQVVCLGRGRSAVELTQRIAKALTIANNSYAQPAALEPLLERVRCIPFDLLAENLGLSDADLADLHALGCSEFWHFAASLNFEPELEEQISATNIEGTRRALQLSERLGIQRFLYISTAYVNGSCDGDAANVVNTTGRFNNHYERTKHAAEMLVIRSGLDYSILRPSIVIGNSETYASAGSRTGLYGFLGQLRRISRLATRNRTTVRIRMARDTRMNFIPVNQFTEDCHRIVRSEVREPRIHNVTADLVLTIRDMESCLNRFDLRNVALVDELADPSTLESIIEKNLGFFTHYLNNPGLNILRTPAGHAGVTLPELYRYAGAILGTPGRVLPNSRPVTVRDGRSVRLHQTSDTHEEALLIVNAYGMPFDFWERVIDAHGAKYDVCAIEFNAAEREPIPSEFFRDVQDVVDVAASLDKKVHLLGWCSGSGLALVASTMIERCASLTCISGGYILENWPRSSKAYTMVTRRLYERVVSSENAARNLYDAMFKRSKVGRGGRGEPDEARDTLTAIMSFANPRYLEWTSEIYEDFELFRNHAAKVSCVYNSPIDRYIERVKSPAMFIIGSSDTYVDPKVTGEVASRIAHSTHYVIPDGDHWIIHSDARVTEKVGEFIARC